MHCSKKKLVGGFRQLTSNCTKTENARLKLPQQCHMVCLNR